LARGASVHGPRRSVSFSRSPSCPAAHPPNDPPLSKQNRPRRTSSRPTTTCRTRSSRSRPRRWSCEREQGARKEREGGERTGTGEERSGAPAAFALLSRPQDLIATDPSPASPSGSNVCKPPGCPKYFFVIVVRQRERREQEDRPRERASRVALAGRRRRRDEKKLQTCRSPYLAHNAFLGPNWAVTAASCIYCPLGASPPGLPRENSAARARARLARQVGGERTFPHKDSARQRPPSSTHTKRTPTTQQTLNTALASRHAPRATAHTALVLPTRRTENKTRSASSNPLAPSSFLNSKPARPAPRRDLPPTARGVQGTGWYQA
jgi:hypothetical protein